MFERFTSGARSAVVTAQARAREQAHFEIGAADLLIGVLDDDQGPAAKVLRQLGLDQPDSLAADQGLDDDRDALASIGVDLDAVRRQAERTFGAGALDRPRRQRSGLFGRRSAGGNLRFSAEAKAALELALREAVSQGHRSLGSGHLFLGLLRTDQATTMDLLRRSGITTDGEALRRRVLAELPPAA